MKIAVLGASGGCGTQLVTQALERGHQVVALVRSTSWQAPQGVDVRRGDLTDERFVREAIRGCDGVLSALGLRLAGLAPWHTPEDSEFLSRSTNALVAAMKAEGVTRVIAISAGGVGDSRPKVPGIMRAMIALTSLKWVYPQLEKMENVLLASGLDVCICRPSGLTDGPRTGAVKIAHGYAGRATISRADVAGWMLDTLERHPFAPERTPMISVTGVKG